jgi:hypothetical protein
MPLFEFEPEAVIDDDEDEPLPDAEAPIAWNFPV